MLGWILLIISVLLILLCLVLLFLNPIKVYLDKNKFQKSVYRTLNFYVEEEDQLLLNNVNLVTSKDAIAPYVFDHIVFADKYIYVISDYSNQGGLYGNINDQYLFLRDTKNKLDKVLNPVFLNEEKVKALEMIFGVPHCDKIFVSVVVFNSTLVVPKELIKKDQSTCSWFLPLNELESTIKKAELDNVTPIPHSQSEEMAKKLLYRSNRTKKEAMNREMSFRRSQM